MKKNLTITVLAAMLILAMIALNHLTNRVDAAINYINDLESCYPDYVDTVSGGDAYSEWYNYETPTDDWEYQTIGNRVYIKR